MSKLVEAVAEFLSRNTSNKPFTKVDEAKKVISEKISPYDLDGHRQSMNHHNEYAETGSKPHLKDKHKEAAKAHKAAADAIEKNSPNAEELSKKAKSMSKELSKHYSYSHDDRHN